MHILELEPGHPLDNRKPLKHNLKDVMSVDSALLFYARKVLGSLDRILIEGLAGRLSMSVVKRGLRMQRVLMPILLLIRLSMRFTIIIGNPMYRRLSNGLRPWRSAFVAPK